MHAEVMAWLRERAAKLPQPERVLEIGSRNINGSAREAWPDLEPGSGWLGCDLEAGSGVQLTADAAAPDFLAKVAASAGMAQTRSPQGGLAPGFDLVVCCEVLEHAEDPAGVVRGAVHALRRGGTLLATCAGPGREPHSAVDGGPLREGEHYENVEPEQLVRWLAAAGLKGPVDVEFHQERGDLYVSTTKPARRASHAPDE